MSDIKLLDTLEANPLPPIAGQRVAAEVTSHLSDLTPSEKTLISRFKSGDIEPFELMEFRSKIWSVIDSTANDTMCNARSNARNRLFVCIVSDVDRLDDNLADIIYHWASICEIDENLVTDAIRAELSRW